VAIGCIADPTIDLKKGNFTISGIGRVYSSDVKAPEMRNHDAPRSWAHGHGPRSHARTNAVKEKLAPGALGARRKECEFHETCTKI
jgi:hypothetical protein